MTRRRRRSGFTLLEVLLASIIAVMLLAALYVAMDVTLTQTDATRESVARSDLSRAVINRMSSDLSHSLGMLPPQSGGDPTKSQSSGGGTSTQVGTGTQAAGQTTQQAGMTTGAGAGGTAGATGAATGTGAAGATAMQDPTATDPTMTTTSTLLPFQGGVFGSDKQLTLFVSRVPLTLSDADAAANAAATPDLPQPGDLRRVVYYLAPDGSGLCRQERPWATADGVGNSTDPDPSTDPLAELIAPEVKDVTFEYLDSTGSWATEWDGSMAGADGVTPTGPPRAIRVTLVLEVPGKRGQTTEKRVQHVFPVRAAVGNYVPPTAATTDPTMTGMTGGSMP